MSQWLTILQKEILEMWRNFKWIWFPISFILLGVSEPLTTYYMPTILDSFGDLPEGAVIELPTPAPAEILYQSISQYNTLGILIIVLASMGIIAAERKSGVAELILVKPVSYTSYILAKWFGALLLVLFSYFIGLFTSWYYVMILFEQIPFTDLLVAYGLFALWLTVVLTITIFFNALFKSQGVVGFISLTSVIILNLITSTFSRWLEWSPAQLPSYTSSYLISGELAHEAVGAISISALVIFILLGLAIFTLKNKEMA